MKSTKLLITDHEIILRALHLLDERVMESERGKELNRDDIRSLLVFFRDFADGCHHVKEEAILFPALLQAGMAFRESPLRVIGYEHECGRVLTSEMSESLDRNNKKTFLVSARRYIRLLNEHIEKENYVLFGMADQLLSDEEDERVASDFEQFERTTGIQTHESAHDAIVALEAKSLDAVA